MKQFVTSHQKLLSIIALLTVLGIAVRLVYFPENIYFGYDQARDAFISQEIYSQGDIRIHGPSSSMRGVFHGPLFYYLIGVLYTIGQGNPVWVALFFILLNAALIPIIYVIGYALTKKPLIGVMAATLFAFSFEQTQWAIFISNTSLAVFGVTLLLCGFSLYWFLQKAYGLVLAALGFFIAVQSEIYLFYLLVPIIAIWVMRKRLPSITKRHSLSRLYKRHAIIFTGSIVLFVAGFASYIAGELLFKFPVIKSVLAMTANTSVDITPYEQIPVLVNRYGLISYYSLFGYSAFYALVTFIAVLFLVFRIKNGKLKQARWFLVLFLFSSTLLLFFQLGFANIYHFSIGASVALMLLASIVLEAYIKRPILLALCVTVLLVGQLRLILTTNRQGASLTLVQKNMHLMNEKRIVAYIADQARTERVGVTALTNPYNINTVWAYMFKAFWPEDRVKPVWVGNFAKGFAGESVLLEAGDTMPCTYVVIYEPNDGIPRHLEQPFIDNENGQSFQIEQHYFGAFKVEKRQLYTCEYTG